MAPTSATQAARAKHRQDQYGQRQEGLQQHDRKRADRDVRHLNCGRHGKDGSLVIDIRVQPHSSQFAVGSIENGKLKTLEKILIELLNQVVVEPHLGTSLRKMGQGQKCSLRFYPEGEMLSPTGTLVNAGYSGDRLGNVLGLLADLGFCSQEGGRFAISADGDWLLKRLEGANEA